MTGPEKIEGDGFSVTPSEDKDKGTELYIDFEKQAVSGEMEAKPRSEEQDKEAMEKRLQKEKEREEKEAKERKELEDRIKEWEDEPTKPGY